MEENIMENFFKKFENNVVVINTTPHAITMKDVTGELVSVESDSSLLINAQAKEEKVSDLFVKTVFESTENGWNKIKEIKETFSELYHDGETLVIIGSIIAAQAYPGEVVAMVPVPGFERVAPTEKRMRCDKFTVFQK